MILIVIFFSKKGGGVIMIEDKGLNVQYRDKKFLTDLSVIFQLIRLLVWWRQMEPANRLY